MAARVEWQGLAAFRDQLRKLPADLRAEGGAIVYAHAQRAYTQIHAAYPVGPGRKGKAGGNLKRGMRIDYQTGKGLSEEFGVGVVVRNRAEHAWLFENGSEARQVSRIQPGRAGNWGLSRGKMPPKPTFIPIAIRVRAQMYRQLEALLAKAGFQVTGHAR